MKIKYWGVFIFSIVFFNSYGQDVQLTSKYSIVKSSWIVGVGINVVDDSGYVFDELFNLDEQWNWALYPSRISVGKYFANGVGLEVIGSHNTYKAGKTIDRAVITEDVSYWAADFRVSYDLNMILGETGWFDPYVGIGAGYTDANNEPRGTYNAVVGFRTWFSDRVGLDFNSSGKWAMGSTATNHLQHAACVVYRFGIEKGLSKKGEEKLALIQEQERLQDSILQAKIKEEEARALAEKLAKEKEKERLLALQKAKQDSVNNLRLNLEKRIKDLGNVYFNFDSANLSTEYKDTLNKLAVILKEYPSLVIEISSHTDSRGAAKYNQWLSEQRSDKTAEYLMDKEISEKQLSLKSFGEEKLVNACGNGVYCTESKHKQNRRSEFSVKEFN